jgi:hypothetical protein
MSRRKFSRPKDVDSVVDVFKNVEEPVSYRISSLSNRGEWLRIVNFGDVPRLTLTVRTPRGFNNVVSIRLTDEGISKGKDRLARVLKALEIIEKMAKDGKISIPKENVTKTVKEDEFSEYL